MRFKYKELLYNCGKLFLDIVLLLIVILFYPLLLVYGAIVEACEFYVEYE